MAARRAGGVDGGSAGHEALSMSAALAPASRSLSSSTRWPSLGRTAFSILACGQAGSTAAFGPQAAVGERGLSGRSFCPIALTRAFCSSFRLP